MCGKGDRTRAAAANAVAMRMRPDARDVVVREDKGFAIAGLGSFNSYVPLHSFLLHSLLSVVIGKKKLNLSFSRVLFET